MFSSQQKYEKYFINIYWKYAVKVFLYKGTCFSPCSCTFHLARLYSYIPAGVNTNFSDANAIIVVIILLVFGWLSVICQVFYLSLFVGFFVAFVCYLLFCSTTQLVVFQSFK